MDARAPRRRSLTGAILAASLAVLSTSCRSPPRSVASAASGTVRAASAHEARRTLELLGEVRPAVEELLGTGGGVPLEVWVGSLDPDLLASDGYTERWRDGRAPVVHLAENAEDARSTLAHELVHALIAEPLRPLPPLLEEGYATWVSRQVAPMTDAVRLSRHVHVAAYFDALLLSVEVNPGAPEQRTLELEVRLEGEPDPRTPEELSSISDRRLWHECLAECGRTRAARFYAVAELCVERVFERRGRAGLHDLVERARRDGLECVPWAWIAEASGLVSRRERSARSRRDSTRPLTLAPTFG